MRALLILILAFRLPPVVAQEYTASFSITPQMDIPVQPVPVEITHLGISGDLASLAVVSAEATGGASLPTQLQATANSARLWFYPAGKLREGVRYDFRIIRQEPGYRNQEIRTVTDDDHILMYAGQKTVLKYRHSMMPGPDGADPLYRRKGAYIHPLYSPGGKVLTEIHPRDHIHQYGIWNPWTRTVFEGRMVDFWNLADGMGTVAHREILSTRSGTINGGFRVYHEHIDYTSPGPDKVALKETWDVSAWSVEWDQREVWIVDFGFELSCATDSSVELSQYRYGGGLAFRPPAGWRAENSTMLTSEGKTLRDADASVARWIMIEGPTGEEERSGVVIMDHPSNHSHPQPLRVWVADAQRGRGPMYIDLCPIRNQQWVLYPGNRYVLRYRMLVFDGEMDPGFIEEAWHHYAYPPAAVFTGE